MAFCEFSDALEPGYPPMNKNTDPKKLDKTNIGDAVVIVTADGVQRSAIVMSITPEGRVTFAWKSGPGPSEVGIAEFGKELLARRVLAIFPAGCKFLAV